MEKAHELSVFELVNYRIAYDIINEYKVLRDVDRRRITVIDEKFAGPQRFVFVLYKVLFPEDYHHIRTNQSVIYAKNQNEVMYILDQYRKNTRQDNSKYKLLEELMILRENDVYEDEAGGSTTIKVGAPNSSPLLKTLAEYFCGISKVWLFYCYFDEVKEYIYETLTDDFIYGDDEEKKLKIMNFLAFAVVYGENEDMNYAKHKKIVDKIYYNIIERQKVTKFLEPDILLALEKLYEN